LGAHRTGLIAGRFRRSTLARLCALL
jgi:hypothetical protein